MELICDEALYTSEIKGQMLNRERLQSHMRRNPGQLTDHRRPQRSRAPRRTHFQLLPCHSLACRRRPREGRAPSPGHLPPYDPAIDEPFPWEADVRAAIEKLKAEKLKAEKLKGG